MLCRNSFSGAFARLKSAKNLCTSEWRLCIGIGWVASHEQTLLPFCTLQPHALLSANSKATHAANNKERLGMRHRIVWCRTILFRPASWPFSVETGSSLFIRRLLACSHDPFSLEIGSSLFIRRLLACSHDPFSVETGSSLFICRLLACSHDPFSVETGSLLFIRRH